MQAIIKKHFWVLIILAAAFLIRIYDLSFPYFTSDEARVAYRGYTLAISGKDELGRSFPMIFNSLTDYQLPILSYIAALGILIFGKTDLGARLPFVATSILIVILVYKMSKIFNLKKEFQYLSATIAAFSPALIFLSKIPNDIILLAFGLLLLFYLLTKKQVNPFALGLTMLFFLSISKIAWWVLWPFTGLTLVFFQTYLKKKTKIIILFLTMILTIGFLSLFLQIPQSTRSLSENNFPIFQEVGIKIVVDRLRGQGLEAGWPNFIEKILFNKFQFVLIGLLNWVNYLEPAILFGQFGQTGIQGFSGMGAFSKITIFPFVAGLIFIIRRGERKLRALALFLPVLTFPIFFLYPQDGSKMIVLVLPFLVLVTALGLMSLNRFLKYGILALIIFEVSVNAFYFSSQIERANYSRPVWIKSLVEDSYKLWQNNQIAISDDFTEDIVPYLEWYAPLIAADSIKNISFPYKFHQNQVAGIKIIGSDDTFYFCGLDKPTYVFASKRDLAKIQRWLNITTDKVVTKIYKNDSGEETVYISQPTICVH